ASVVCWCTSALPIGSGAFLPGLKAWGLPAPVSCENPRACATSCNRREIRAAGAEQPKRGHMNVKRGDIPWLRRCRSLWLLLLMLRVRALLACGPLSNEPRPPTATSARTPEATLTPLGARIDTYMSGLAQSGDLRGSVLVARGDTVLLSKGYGVADEASGALN